MSRAAPLDDVDAVRRHARRIVRRLGFLRRGLAGTDLPPSAIHALLEIGSGAARGPSELSAALELEKSTVSRLLAGLEAKGLVDIRRSADDPRRKVLALTARGRALRRDIEAHARAQVSDALSRAGSEMRRTIVAGLAAYAEALPPAAGAPQGSREAPPLGASGSETGAEILIARGYAPGLIARVTEMQARYYAETFGFGVFFERKVASEMAEFFGRLEEPRNLTLRAERFGRVIGAISIDGEDLGAGAAHVRWFIAEDQGRGVGRALLREAMAHVDAHGFAETRLWTFDGLEPARRLYERAGFALAEARQGRQWGVEVTEQMYVRRRRA